MYYVEVTCRDRKGECRGGGTLPNARVKSGEAEQRSKAGILNSQEVSMYLVRHKAYEEILLLQFYKY